MMIYLLLVILLAVSQGAPALPKGLTTEVKEAKIMFEVDSKVWQPFTHNDPFPSYTSTTFSGIFRKDFLKEVYYLQNNITNMVVNRPDGSQLTLADVCCKSNLQPCVNSALQYFQNNVTALDDMAMDATGFFVVAGYLDHIMSCTMRPNMPSALHKSCSSKDGHAIAAESVFGAVKANMFWRSVRQYLTFTLATETPAQSADAQLWLDAFNKHLLNVSDQLMKRGVRIKVPSPKMKQAKLIVMADHNVWKYLYHMDPYPMSTKTLFSGTLRKDFLKEVYYLQNNITNMVVNSPDGSQLTLADVCYKSNLQPCVNSALQYFQNNVTALDDVAMDASGFFVTADYLDHIMSCIVRPTMSTDFNGIHRSCLSKEGHVIVPETVFGFEPANMLWRSVIQYLTFTLATETAAQSADAQLWLDAFNKHLLSVSDPLMKRGVDVLYIVAE